MPGERWQFAVLVGKKLGTAPVRNLHKRWAREAFRTQRNALPVPGSIIVRFQQTAPNFQHVQSEILEAYHLALQNSHRAN